MQFAPRAAQIVRGARPTGSRPARPFGGERTRYFLSAASELCVCVCRARCNTSPTSAASALSGPAWRPDAGAGPKVEPSGKQLKIRLSSARRLGRCARAGAHSNSDCPSAQWLATGGRARASARPRTGSNIARLPGATRFTGRAWPAAGQLAESIRAREHASETARRALVIRSCWPAGRSLANQEVGPLLGRSLGRRRAAWRPKWGSSALTGVRLARKPRQLGLWLRFPQKCGAFQVPGHLSSSLHMKISFELKSFLFTLAERNLVGAVSKPRKFVSF